MELAAFAQQFAARGREAFDARVREPGLVGARYDVTIPDAVPTPIATHLDEGLERSAGDNLFVHSLRKRDGANPFAGMITIGRATNNDIVLEDPGVSKFHAYARAVGGSWMLTDAGSLNGTWVDQVRLARDRSTVLRPLAIVRLGKELTLTFYPPPELYELCAGALKPRA
jgi:hypothetical protein